MPTWFHGCRLDSAYYFLACIDRHRNDSVLPIKGHTYARAASRFRQMLIRFL